MLVEQVMSTPVIAVAPGEKIKHVAGLLVDRGFSAVPVIDDDGDLVGIVSEADLLGAGSSRRAAPPVTVDEVMTRAVFALPAGAPVTRAAGLMLERKFRSLPVTEGGEVVGMVSRRDLVRALANDDGDIQEQLRVQLRELARRLAGLGIHVRDGVVTRTGELPPGAVRLAEAMASDLAGVLAVRFEPVGTGR
jgi:CBS domain-containing protein